MGMDISCIGGIGFEAIDLLNMYENHQLTLDYNNDNLEQEETLDNFFSGNEYVSIDYLYSYDGTKYYIFATDPINGVQIFIDELIRLGFEDLTIDNLEFHSNAKVW